MSPDRPPRYRVTVHELRDGTTTKVIDAYGSGFITAVATTRRRHLEVHFGEGGPGTSNSTSPPRSPTSTHPGDGANALPPWKPLR